MEPDISEIILVEDNLSDARLISIGLKDTITDHPIVHLKNGEDAIAYLFATGSYEKNKDKVLPSLILLDLKMPKVSGIDVLEKIKSADRTKAIPVVVFTSSRIEEDIIKCYELGANSYVVKPVEFNEFQKFIKEIGIYWISVNQVRREA
jgi:two-component system response regulator